MISGNIIRDNSNHGMLVDSERNCTIADNEIYRNQDGIRLLYVTNTTIIRNFIYENELDGIFVWDCPDEINIINNTIYNNEKNGIHVLNSRFTFIQDVILYGNTLNGVFLNSSRSCILNPSKIYDNSMNGVLLNNVTTTSISDNEICDNAEYGVYIDGESSANSVENNIIGWNGAGNAHDDGSSNTWLFNGWGDYTGALGTYAIPGSAGSVDTYPEKADTVAPTINSPADIQYELGSTGHSITWTPSDDHPSLYWVYIVYGATIESGDWFGGTISINVDALSVGEYTYNVIVYDTCNNSISDEVIVTVVDTTLPVIRDISHNPTTPITVEAVTVDATVTDLAGVAQVILSYSSNDGVSWSNTTMINWSGNQYSGTIPAHAPDTTITFKIFAKDNNDNWHTSTDHSYQVASVGETNPPNISGLSVSPATVYEGDTITISVTVADESSLAEVKLSYSTDNEATWSNITMSRGSGDEWSAVIPGQTQGTTVYYKVYARDVHGNLRVSGTGVVVVRAPPAGIDPMLLMIIGAGGLGLVVVVAIVVMKKRPKKPKPPEYIPPKPPEELEALREVPPPIVAAEPEVVEKTVKAMRGAEIVGGKFEYKIKVKNDTDFVITNVSATIISYPDDCMELEGPKIKTLKRIGSGEFRSPQFTLLPTKDCVEGKVLATVTFIDHMDKTHMMEVEPYVIRSVCDLLKPLEASLDDFDLMLSDMAVTSEERTMNWNAEVLYSKAKTLLAAKNFYIIEEKSETVDNEFRGHIRCLAEGKYTGKRVALRLIISGPADGTQANVEVEGLGEDIAMLPTTIDEISKGIDSWTCMNCGGALDSNEVTRIKSGDNVECRYCRHIMTIDLYRK
jgi:parallel beta-helix repeat protein